MIRVLSPKGSLLIVSLLQPHVLKILLDFFIGECGENKHRETNLFQVKLQRIEHIHGYAEKQFIKYFVSIRKNPIDPAKQADMRLKLQNQVGIRDSLNQAKEYFFDHEKTTEKVKIDQ